MAQPNPTTELPANPACETLTIRQTLTVNGLPVTGGGATIQTDNVTVQGDGSALDKVRIKQVQHDATLSGDGTVATPLAVAGRAVVFDTVAGATNLRGNQAANRSPIDNTKSRIVNLSSKTGTIPGAVGATANNATIAGGDDNDASNTNAAVGGGAGNKASGQHSVVPGGLQNTASGFGARASGFSCLSSGTVSEAHGNQCSSTADYAVTFGSQCSTGAAHGFTAGLQNTNSGGGVVFGQQNNCTGADAFVIGTTNQASIHDSEAHGIQCDASRLQKSLAYGSFDLVTKGQAQTSELVYRGTTPGAAANESVVLLSSTALTQDGPRLQDNKAYAFVVTCIAAGVQAGPTNVSRTLVLRFTAQRIAGVSVITGIDTVDTGIAGSGFGSAGTADWTIVPTVAAGPDRLVLTFKTGATATAAKAVARIEMTEVAAF